MLTHELFCQKFDSELAVCLANFYSCNTPTVALFLPHMSMFTTMHKVIPTLKPKPPKVPEAAANFVPRLTVNTPFKIPRAVHFSKKGVKNQWVFSLIKLSLKLHVDLTYVNLAFLHTIYDV